MDNNTARTPKRFGQTAAASIDPHKQRVSLSTYAGQELLLMDYRPDRSQYGDYVVIKLKRHGEPAEEVTTSSEKIIEQLAALTPSDWPCVAWLHQAESKNGKSGRLWLSDQSPEETKAAKVALVAEIGRLGKRGD